MEKYQNLIIGAGFSGAVLANKIATELKESVLLIDSKPHIAGNCYDFKNDYGITVHKYGTHIFHTPLKQVWDFLCQFTDWHPYSHCVRAMINGKEVPVPFNLNSIDLCFNLQKSKVLKKKLIAQFGMNVKVPILKLKQCQDVDLQELAEFVYQNVFLNYTLKQWGVKPEDLDPAVTGRVPVYISYDNRYFQDLYQGIPSQGYTTLIQKMLNNPHIDIKLNTKFDKKVMATFKRVFCTGPIDEFFEYKLGCLPYRSLKFDFQTKDIDYFQNNSVINYPNEHDYTRIGEYKYFLNEKSSKSVISYEYPQAYDGTNDPYYPIVKDENSTLYQAYLKEAKELTNTYFLGRLGDYKYYDMDKAIMRALELFETIKEK